MPAIHRRGHDRDKRAGYRAERLAGSGDAGVAVGNVAHRTRNVVATADFGRSLNLDPVVRSIPRCLYEPGHFPAVIIRRQNPGCAILLFASGKMVCVGAKSEAAASSKVNRPYSDLVEKDAWLR